MIFWVFNFLTKLRFLLPSDDLAPSNHFSPSDDFITKWKFVTRWKRVHRLSAYFLIWGITCHHLKTCSPSENVIIKWDHHLQIVLTIWFPCHQVMIFITTWKFVTVWNSRRHLKSVSQSTVEKSPFETNSHYLNSKSPFEFRWTVQNDRSKKQNDCSSKWPSPKWPFFVGHNDRSIKMTVLFGAKWLVDKSKWPLFRAKMIVHDKNGRSIQIDRPEDSKWPLSESKCTQLYPNPKFSLIFWPLYNGHFAPKERSFFP